MKVLIVANHNTGRFSPFVTEQVNTLNLLGIETDYYGVVGKGTKGYWGNRKKLKEKINEYKPDLIHAHYGLSGLLANLQRRVPVVTTYHGSDINDSKAYIFSRLSISLSAFNIFVSEKIREKAGALKKSIVIPCGVDVDLFKPVPKSEARIRLGLKENEKLVLFAGAFNNHVKNAYLAHQAIALLSEARLIELKNYSREEVSLLFNAVDAALLTSYTEGSPQFIKEAMACNCPVVSVDVGDVKDVLNEVSYCYVSTYDANDISGKLQEILHFNQRTDGRNKIKNLALDLNSVAKKIIDVYSLVLTK